MIIESLIIAAGIAGGFFILGEAVISASNIATDNLASSGEREKALADKLTEESRRLRCYTEAVANVADDEAFGQIEEEYLARLDQSE